MIDLSGPWLACLTPGFDFVLVALSSVWFSALVLSQGLSFYSDEDLLSIWTPVIMVWSHSFKSGLLIYVCC